MKSAPFIIVRGAPGAGKSTFAKLLKEKLDQKFFPCVAAIFETDGFFVDAIDGQYRFDASLLGTAHAWNQGEVARFLRDYSSMCSVIVANTFSRESELLPYLEIAKKFGRPIYVFTLHTEHENVHGVPRDTAQKYRARVKPITVFTDKGISAVFDLYTDEEANASADAFAKYWI